MEQSAFFTLHDDAVLVTQVGGVASMPHATAGIVRLNARSAQLKRRDVLHVDPQTGEGMHPWCSTCSQAL